MTISCIIPTRDRCALLDRAIKSVMRQTVAGIEIVVVDDGSIDGTVSMVKRRFPEVRLVRLDGRGPGAARNAGVAVSRGRILMFLDSDDLWVRGHARRLAAILEQGGRVAYGTTRTVDTVGRDVFHIPEPGGEGLGDCREKILTWCFLVPSAVAVTREVFDLIGGFREWPPQELGEDWDFFIRLSRQSHFGFSGPDPVTIRFLHKGSLCRLTGSAAILTILDRLQQSSEAADAFPASNKNHWYRMQRFVKENGHCWTTVQQWYQAAKKEGLI